MEASESLIVVLSALLAGLSFMAFALPLLNREEKKDRYRNVISQKRRALFEQTKEQITGKGKGAEALSARESVAMFFKAQKLLGSMGDKVRDQMLQAGIRSPSAPIKFITVRIALPFVFMGVGMLILSSGDKEIDDNAVFFVLMIAMFGGYGLPKLLLKNLIQKRSEEINLTFPDALDMMLICVQGGIGLEQTVDRIAEEIAEHSPTLAEELGILSAEMAMLNERGEALKDFSRRVGSGAAKSFATALIQAEQYGTSVSKALRVMSDELRDQRMALAEQKAASLPPKLTVPMIAFFLPVLFIIILGPVIIQIMQM